MMFWFMIGLSMAMQPLHELRYNFLVAIKYQSAFVSVGTLLQMNVVLTSAVHMTMREDDYVVYAGRYNLSLPATLGWGRVLRVKSIHVHPHYRRAYTRFNFAVVKLDREVDTPVRVKLDVHNRANEKNRSLVMLGWGVGIGNRQETPVGIVGRIAPFNSCIGFDGQRLDRRVEFCFTHSDAILDSGSPAIAFSHHGIPVIVGIASWAFPFEVSKHPPSFCMVDSIASWIKRIIADADAPSRIPATVAKSPLMRAT
ncbi:hypothetical protein DSO57_1023455 [Entomophthora muscae]|uniref:Uncharacterized protein n=1 Tax=Entomophthora muscae TaxID=34485 RepID=A0ACC2S4Q1_9FUNG|nr:hypothetical protein DSO57_1023455 [Entomophthora muscae]